jgi:hypothetical protein
MSTVIVDHGHRQLNGGAQTLMSRPPALMLLLVFRCAGSAYAQAPTGSTPTTIRNGYARIVGNEISNNAIGRARNTPVGLERWSPAG